MRRNRLGASVIDAFYLDQLKKKSEISAERFTEANVPIDYGPVRAEMLGLTRLRHIIECAFL